MISPVHCRLACLALAFAATAPATFVPASLSVLAVAQQPSAPVPGLPLAGVPRDGDRPPQTGTGIIRGRILQRDSSQPLRKVLVTLRATGVRDLPTALTDDEGYYELQGLPPARFTLTASKGGFVTLEYGQRRPNEPGRPVDLADGGTLQGIDILLAAGGAISGQVVNSAGEPVSGVVVQASRQRFVGGVREPGDVAGTADVTDDLGRFRVFGLPQGGFFLSAVVSDPRAPDLIRIATARSRGVPTFYPGTLLAAQAQPLYVGAGDQIAGLLLQTISVPGSAISGVVRTADGSAPAQSRLSLGQLRPNGWSSRNMQVRPDGSFSVGLPGEGESRELDLSLSALP